MSLFSIKQHKSLIFKPTLYLLLPFPLLGLFLGCQTSEPLRNTVYKNPSINLLKSEYVTQTQIEEELNDESYEFCRAIKEEENCLDKYDF